MAITKGELTAQLAEQLGVTQILAKSFLTALTQTVGLELKAAGEFKLVDIGTFEVCATAARKGVNPRTLEEMTIPAGKRIAFRPAKALKERIK